MYNAYYDHGIFYCFIQFVNKNEAAYDACRFVWGECDDPHLSEIFRGVSFSEYFPHIDYVEFLSLYEKWRTENSLIDYPSVIQSDGCPGKYESSDETISRGVATQRRYERSKLLLQKCLDVSDQILASNSLLLEEIQDFLLKE